jgi:hypothetical protein
MLNAVLMLSCCVDADSCSRRRCRVYLSVVSGRIEIVRDGVLEVVSFPTPLSVRSAVGDVNVDDALKQLKTSPDISRDFHANKLRDFVRQSGTVLNVIKCQNQLNMLARTSSSGNGSSMYLSSVLSRHALSAGSVPLFWSVCCAPFFMPVHLNRLTPVFSSHCNCRCNCVSYVQSPHVGPRFGRVEPGWSTISLETPRTGITPR